MDAKNKKCIFGIYSLGIISMEGSSRIWWDFQIFSSFKCMMEKIEYDNMVIRDSKCSMKYDGFAICVGDINAITLWKLSFQMQYYHINMLLSSCSILF